MVRLFSLSWGGSHIWPFQPQIFKKYTGHLDDKKVPHQKRHRHAPTSPDASGKVGKSREKSGNVGKSREMSGNQNYLEKIIIVSILYFQHCHTLMYWLELNRYYWKTYSFPSFGAMNWIVIFWYGDGLSKISEYLNPFNGWKWKLCQNELKLLINVECQLLLKSLISDHCGSFLKW